ncbi:hypothetical protein [Paraburkholderia unamae]|uniref:Lipoprotein n=1 Tax=Paraburkholderia unamae TaxID=219649 RepID=A0ABX5KAD0_9BURK|nr:hypothetical protein [Paraburkholderia unamae]PVX61110.1 hypothetical protein C7402_14544 [Paraburkholderia unamae]RAR51645.1 hypothetical protein C7401_1365 [Paraburkholderia unamae]CAG9251141.1 conserved exported hypothetical protein [Paraburkholderia unamae]
MKRIALSLCVVVCACVAGPAFANCWGNDAFQNCVDESGNSYTVQRFGNTSTVNGYQQKLPGEAWQQTGASIGDTTFITGQAADGSTWTETIRNYGNGSRTISGMDGNGLVYNKNCTSYGCH